MSSIYTPEFFDSLREGSRRSARRIVPRLVASLAPSSVVDVGCGDGTWLGVFRELGLTDLLGIDAPWIPTEILRIEKRCFRAVDLEEFDGLEREFDLALSLEVADNLAPAAAPRFVAALCRIAPVIVFSAAIPAQGGAGHVNERWPEYWAELFAVHDFVAVDVLRTAFWRDPYVEWWYKQNLLAFVRRGEAELQQSLYAEFATPAVLPLPLVHPDAFFEACSVCGQPRAQRDDKTAIRYEPPLPR